MMKKFLTIILVALVFQEASATRVEIDCPCDITNTSQTALSISAGISNIDSTDSGPLRFRLIAHDTPSFFDSAFFTIGTHQLVNTIPTGSKLSTSEFKTGLAIPLTATFYFTLFLEEMQNGNWVRVDSIRMRDKVMLSKEFASSVDNGLDKGSAFYFDGDPTIEVNGEQVTIDLPAIVNDSASYSSERLVVKILQANGPSVFNFQFFTAANVILNTQLPAKSQLTVTTIVTNFTEESREGFDYFVLTISEEVSGSVLVYQTVRVNTGEIPQRAISTSGIEVLEDDDGDGVSNFNERFRGTDLADAESKPGESSLDVIVIYTQGVPALYDGDPSARIDQLVQVSNQVFQNSGLDIKMNLTHTVEKTVAESAGLNTLLDMLDKREVPFQDIDTLKTMYGGDIVILLLPFQTGDTLCGLANLIGSNLGGDFVASNSAKFADSVLYIDCDDTTMVHEVGHVMGLGHSRRQDGNGGGTFDWSVGYGVDNLFVTVMAYAEEFGHPPERLRFASPAETCSGVPCGITREDSTNGADAALSLKSVQYQVEDFSPSQATDTDNDGLPDVTDPDDDNDGVPDVSDTFPLDASEFVDTDNDGTGNNADTDDDDDGTLDVDDAFPLDSTEILDTDEDGIGDNADIGIRLGAGQTIELPIVGKTLLSAAGLTLTVPADATAVSINVTAVTPTSAGFVTVWPCGVERPLASNLNFVAGDVRPNGVIAPVGTQGSVCFYSLSDTDLIVDVAGWFVGDAFSGATPLRLVDTRDGTGGQSTKLVASAPLTIPVANLAVTSALGVDTIIPAIIDAVALNVTVVNPESGGFITVYPCDVPRPLSSNVNYTAGQVVANGVISPVSANGKVCVYTLAEADIVVDLAGWLPSSTPSAFTGVTPKRLVDTRDGAGGQFTKLAPPNQLSVAVHGTNVSASGITLSIPTTATAAALNVTIVNPEGAGFATVWPCSAVRPLASNLNFATGDVVANNVVAPIDSNGEVCFYTNVPSNIIVDIAGYFSGTGTDAFVGSTPKRFLDTRDGTGPRVE